jgi:hypothetical protein
MARPDDQPAGTSPFIDGGMDLGGSAAA